MKKSFLIIVFFVGYLSGMENTPDKEEGDGIVRFWNVMDECICPKFDLLPKPGLPRSSSLGQELVGSKVESFGLGLPRSQSLTQGPATSKIGHFDRLCRIHLINTRQLNDPQTSLYRLDLKSLSIEDLELYIMQNRTLAKVHNYQTPSESQLALFPIKEVDLEGNSLTELPSSFEQLAPHLVKLSLVSNKFKHVPPVVIHKLTRLKELSMYGNPLDTHGRADLEELSKLGIVRKGPNNN